MKQSVSLNWMNNMAFEANANGHKIIIDAPHEAGGQDLGPRPKTLMLVALGGCTGMDVVSLLKKMRVDYEKLEIIVEGNTADDHPKKFLKMKVIFNFIGNNLSLEKIQKAADLSREKYCGVSANYKSSIEIDYEINIHDPDK